MKLVLLGDSIFDNGAYVGAGEPDVLRQVQEALPPAWQATSLASDGASISAIRAQLAALPSDTTHLAISIGGNDVLDELGIFSEPATSMAGALERLAAVCDPFEAAYHRMLNLVLERKLPTLICTIYEGWNPDALHQKLGATAVKLFNDLILTEAITAGIPVLDLRQVCFWPEDYANPIEPSAIGGEKIAAGIVQIVTTHDFSGSTRQIYV